MRKAQSAIHWNSILKGIWRKSAFLSRIFIGKKIPHNTLHLEWFPNILNPNSIRRFSRGLLLPSGLHNDGKMASGPAASPSRGALPVQQQLLLYFLSWQDPAAHAVPWPAETTVLQPQEAHWLRADSSSRSSLQAPSLQHKPCPHPTSFDSQWEHQHLLLSSSSRKETRPTQHSHYKDTKHKNSIP